MDQINLDFQILNEHVFPEIADALLNKSILMINHKKYRIVEIEFYLKNKYHKDKYVHCNPEQLLYGTYYFHKFGNGTYKAGTFKGMDITLGDISTSTYFGILIRSIKDLTENLVIEGPCNVVNRILLEYHCANIEEFTNGESLDIFNNDRQFIIKNKIHQNEQIYYGQRIGLSSKYPKFQNLSYRYLILKDKIKKQKSQLVEI